MKRIIFLACMQADTQYAADVVNDAGGNCGHEQSFSIRTLRPSRASGEWAGRTSESGIYALPSLEASAVEGTYVVHLAKSPLEVVREASSSGLFSFASGNPRAAFLQWLATIEPAVLRQKTELGRAAQYWLLLSARFSSVADITVPIEDFDLETLERIADAAGHELNLEDAEGVNPTCDLGGRDNSISWDDLYEVEGVEIAAKSYGYGAPVKADPSKDAEEAKAKRVEFIAARIAARVAAAKIAAEERETKRAGRLAKREAAVAAAVAVAAVAVEDDTEETQE